jgi:outer membrane protein OmpA-like peptidoglycan-associated protein
MARLRFNFLPALIVIGLLAVGGYYAKIKFIDGPKPGPDAHVTPGMDTPVPPGPDNPVGTTGGGAVDKPNFSLEDQANAKARTDVLARIDLMPHLTEAQKSKLTTSVDRARSMGCIFIVPFEAGKKALGPKETDILAKGFSSASIKQLMEDPTLVFVVLGYADKGDSQSEKTSIDRAQSVLGAMKDRCNVQNVMYSVGMGAATLADAKSAAKNRIVEVWAVYPN